ncbi:glycosyltransferase [Paenibacillus urinalis]|uniref:glycosyltransferase n=1 Tax=Paenibacillus urinalis TaxID=521520 RepID=UPI00195F2C5D
MSYTNNTSNNKDPLTSIIILTHNKLEYTQDCINSIRKHTDPGSYEIIVVDNKSNDGTQEWLHEQRDIKTIFNENNLGFPKGCNQGIEISSGENILLLNNDILVTPSWLDILLNGLYSSENIGAVGPVTNNAAYYQSIQTSYESIEQMYHFAQNYNRPDPRKWERRLKLVGFCMLIKKKVFEELGFLDEIFTPGNFEDDDLSFRMIKSGYELRLCKDVFIHHYGSVSFRNDNREYLELLEKNEKKFMGKWGFNSTYSSNIRNDIISLIDEDVSANLRILEVGCACGGTLLGIKNKYPNAQLFGLELNESSAAIASTFAEVEAADVEQNLTYPEDFFDYIIFPDVLEHLNDPWVVVENVKKHLKKDGKVLASIPNIMYYSVLRDTLNGRWTYTDAGLLDKTHVRFFTLYEIEKMFKNAGYNEVFYSANVLPETKEDSLYIDMLAKVGQEELKEQYRVYQYLVKAHKGVKRTITNLIEKLEDNQESSQAIEDIISLIKKDNVSSEAIVEAMGITGIADKQLVYNVLASNFYNEGLYDHIFPLLSASLLLNPKHRDTLYNLGYLLFKAGDDKLSKYYLEQIEEPDEEVQELVEQLFAPK